MAEAAREMAAIKQQQKEEEQRRQQQSHQDAASYSGSSGSGPASATAPPSTAVRDSPRQQSAMPEAHPGSASSGATGGASLTQAASSSSQAGLDEPCGCPYIGFTLSSNFLDAQSLWDASMGHAIAQALRQPSARLPAGAGSSSTNTSGGSTTRSNRQTDSGALHGADVVSRDALDALVLHVCGKFHCEDWLGTVEHLRHHAPGAKSLVVIFEPSHDGVVANEQSLASKGALNRADFVILTDAMALPPSTGIEHPI